MYYESSIYSGKAIDILVFGLLGLRSGARKCSYIAATHLFPWASTGVEKAMLLFRRPLLSESFGWATLPQGRFPLRFKLVGAQRSCIMTFLLNLSVPFRMTSQTCRRSQKEPGATQITPKSRQRQQTARQSKIGSARQARMVWTNFVGAKTWEIRGENASKRERIALAKSGSGTLVGEVTIVDTFVIGQRDASGSWQPSGDAASFLLYEENKAKHCVMDPSHLQYNKAYAWVLQDAQKYAKPQSYTHKKGHQTWIRGGAEDNTLPDETLVGSGRCEKESWQQGNIAGSSLYLPGAQPWKIWPR